MPRLGLAMLGALQVTLGGQPATGFESAKSRALLVYLALESDRPHMRDHLAGFFWPDQPDQAARTNLRQTLANLRFVLGDRNSPRDPFLLVSREAVQFNNSSDHSLDTAAFKSLLESCAQHPHRHAHTCKACAARLEQAVTLYRGNFLDQFFVDECAPFEEWALVRQEDLRRLALDALAQLAEFELWRGGYTQALRHATRLLQVDPWNEQAHRQMMKAYAALGQRSTALQQYENCRRLLAKEMHADPSEETTALYESISQERATGAQQNRASPSLPVAPTPFVGRERELAELADLISNPECRLLSIVGPGGIGKTRLAIAAAADQRDQFEDGAFFVPLAAQSSIDQLAPAIMAAMGVSLVGSRDPNDQLLAYLSAREVLLVLDTFEHLLAGADLLASVLARAPRVVLLVTSRERLKLQGEWTFELAGLEIPAGGLPEEAEKYSAVQLFIQAARRGRTQCQFSDEEKAIIVRVCRLVDGVPLAIELASAWTRSLSCRQIAEEIEKSYSFLSATFRDTPQRHRSMRAVFEHSWDLLGPQEQDALSALSIFRGGFTQTSAAPVAGAGLALLTALMDKSVVHSSARERYDLHDLVRQFAFEKLDQSGQVRTVRDQHLTHFLALAEQADPHLYDSTQKVWLGKLDVEHDNLRTALRWAIESQDAERALRLANALWRFWYVHGDLIEGLKWCEQALALGGGLETVDLAKALNSAGVFAYLMGDRVKARAHYEASLDLSRRLNNRPRLSSVLNNLGMLARAEGDWQRAIALFEEVLALSKELDDQPGVATALNNLGITWLDSGDLARARAVQEQNLEFRRERGDTWGIATALVNLSTIATHEADYGRGARLAQEALQLNREIENKRGIAIGLKDLARLARYQGQSQRSRELLAESLPLLEELGDKPEIASCLLGFVASLIERGCFEHAAILLGADDRLIETIGRKMDRIDYAEYERERAALEQALGQEGLTAAWEQGRALDIEQALAFARRVAG